MNDFFDDSDQSRQRRRRRLREELLLDDESIEIIQRLCSQLVAAQQILINLQAELAVYRSERGGRLEGYRRAAAETPWRDAAWRDQN